MMILKKQLLQPRLNSFIGLSKRSMSNFIIPGDTSALAGLKAAPVKKIFYFVSGLRHHLNSFNMNVQVLLRGKRSAKISSCKYLTVLLL